MESCAFFQGPSSLAMDSLDSTDEPHPRFPVRGLILRSVGRDTLTLPDDFVTLSMSSIIFTVEL
jgi:hypothetical protein